MTRWHEPECLTPDINLDGVTCFHHVALAIMPQTWKGYWASKKITARFRPLHPMNQKGEWTCGGLLLYTREDETNNDGNGLDTSTNSSIYPGKLCYGEFRLACITSPGHDQPVHLDLETHSIDNCPEYETASYTWGGEEDDNTKKYPVFVGPYGDVSFQTRNCWEMLRFSSSRVRDSTDVD
ncbi:hypothetical protein QC763_401720 [Podospora pseudopauciseta]|uniref:Uncharacterized protein n=1 Tax=Podospora pseudopauciseta TaxID=2093780 RepID=A0ABR0HBJ8_9PEZI|nr:hypothetical protein QC763_401720 [Podospora pseudopauciseta]